MPRFCDNCGREHRDEARFCQQCGNSLCARLEVGGLLREAEDLCEGGQWDTAWETYQVIMEKEPMNEVACVGIARIYGIRGMIGEVINQYFHLMDMLEKKGEFDRALEVAGWIQRLQPDNDRARMRAILFNKKKGDIEEVARQSLELARLYAAVGLGDRSILLLERVLEDIPESFEIAMELAAMHMINGDVDEASLHYFRIACDWLDRKEFTRAAEAYRHIRNVAPDNEDDFRSIGGIFKTLNCFGEAGQVS